MTSDLDDLKRRAVAARIPALPNCEIDPDDPECSDPPTTVFCEDNPACAGYCDEQGVCRPQSCRDVALSVGETAMDCGGASCAPCANGKACLLPRDCSSDICENGFCVPTASTPIGDEPDAGMGMAGSGGQPSVDSGVEDGGLAPNPNSCVEGCVCMGTPGEDAVMFCSTLTLSWASASSFCQMHDMLLTPIETRTENDMLGNWAESLDVTSFWIGASDRSEESDWDWTNGTDLWMGGPASCPEGAVEGPDNNRCYLATSSDSYTRCYDTCVAEGPGWALTAIQSPAENDVVRDLIGARQYGGWIGANDLATEGTWGWVVADPDPTRVTPFWMGGANGDKVTSSTYTNWGGSDPGGGDDENCASMDGSGRWTDVACGFNGRVGICEGPMQGPIDGTFHAFAEQEPQVADCLSAAGFLWYAQDCALSKPFVCSTP